jgi:hypothetical protein
MDKNSKLNNNDRAATLKKEKIKNNTEKIGFLVQTTKLADVKQKSEKIIKRLNLTNIWKRFKNIKNQRLKRIY